ncbi:MAG: SDR family NAD(P)-dependent oxidoreductase [Myxococcota bacterium]|nr:SDR family NAD(P)-dependent oxidoreductase [Myxococcota bacterium]
MTKTASGGAVVVVGVGAQRGTGAALARRFAREGFHTFVAGRTAKKIEAVAQAIRSEGFQATAIVTDTTRSEDVSALLDRAIAEAGPLEAVLYNAGNNQFSPLLEMDDEFFENLWRVCCFGGFLVGREAARRMVPQGRGSILFTGATASMRARPPFTAFASAKAALRAVAFGMAREFGAQGLHVGHVVIDGVINGDVVNERFPGIQERLGADGMLAVDDIAEAFWTLHSQPRSAWTLELDVRPFKETF